MVGASEIQPAVPAFHHSEVNRIVDWSWSPNILTLLHKDFGRDRDLQVGS